MTHDQYTWKQFSDAVLGLMPLNRERQIQGDEGSQYIPNLIRQGVIRIQSAIPEFRLGHEALYYPGDLVSEGLASRGVKPPQSTIRDIRLVEISEDGKLATRYGMDPCEWENRFLLVYGKMPVNAHRGMICVDPQGYTFYAYPEVKERWLISMFWDGMKFEFRDDEATPFTEGMTLAVADFVQAHVARHVEKDYAGYDSLMRSFQGQMPMLFAEAKDRRRTR